MLMKLLMSHVNLTFDTIDLMQVSSRFSKIITLIVLYYQHFLLFAALVLYVREMR